MNYYKKAQQSGLAPQDNEAIRKIISKTFPGLPIMTIQPMTVYQSRAFGEDPKHSLEGAVVDILERGLKRKSIELKKINGIWTITK